MRCSEVCAFDQKFAQGRGRGRRRRDQFDVAGRLAPPALGALLSRGAEVGDVARKTLAASRDAALETAEKVVRGEGADEAADALHSARTATGVLDPDEQPIADYTEMNVSEAVAAVKDLTEPADIRAIIAFEEAHKNRHGVVSAEQPPEFRAR